MFLVGVGEGGGGHGGSSCFASMTSNIQWFIHNYTLVLSSFCLPLILPKNAIDKVFLTSLFVH